MAAEAFVLFLDEKNQKSSQPKCFFAARGHCPAKQVKPQATAFCGCAHCHFCKIPDALSITQGHQFYLLSSEAVRLTFCIKQHSAIIKTIKKKRKGQSGCAAGSLACEVAA